MKSPGTQAGAASRQKIERSLQETQLFLGIDTDISWSGQYYQISNRIAHLYLLRQLNGLNAHLIFVCFINAEDVNGPASELEWQDSIALAKQSLGIPKVHPLSDYIHDAYVDCRRLAG